MTIKHTDIDWTGVSEPMARQIVQQAETFMQAQLQAALGSDQRALTMAGVLVTIATATFAGALAYWDKSGNAPILTAGLVAGVFMVIGAGLAVWAGRPIDFYFPGNQPENWLPIRQGNLVEALGGEAENYGHHIDANAAKISANHKALAWAAVLAVASPAVGMAAWAVTYAWCRA